MKANHPTANRDYVTPSERLLFTKPRLTFWQIIGKVLIWLAILGAFYAVLTVTDPAKGRQKEALLPPHDGPPLFCMKQYLACAAPNAASRPTGGKVGI